jgi:hypothetical protein
MDRIKLYPKDIQLLLSLSERQARRVYEKLMDHFQKIAPQFITVSEFCLYFKLEIKEVESKLKS